MKIFIRLISFLIFGAVLTAHTNAYAVMFPQEIEQEMKKEKAISKTDEWQDLERQRSEIQKTISALEKQVWGPDSEERTHYLRVQITHLRHKIESDPNKPQSIKTESGIGYRFCLL